jgi:lipopolysaccharide transport system ATP-binding protein
MDKRVIEISHLTKEYALGVIGHGTLYQDLQSWWAKLRGAEDPNSIVGSRKIVHGEEFLALEDISFDVNEGDIVGVIGKNGAGKSTLLKILSRITYPTSGRVKIRGRVASLLEVGTGFHGELTGRENVYLNGAILGMSKSEIAKKFDEIVAFSEVGRFIDTPVKRYSSGMMVRLAFSVAAQLEPEILIIDEVLAVGDLAFRKKCLGRMREISSSSGRTIVFVSHDMSAIQNICNKGVLLEQGRLIYSGSSGDAVKEYLRQNEVLRVEGLEWNNSTSQPFSEVVLIKKFQIIERATGEVARGTLFSSKQYSICIQGIIIKPDSRLIILVAFYSDSQEILFTTDAHDLGKNDFGSILPGMFKLTVDLPQELLASRSYEIELLCALHHTGWIFPPNNEARLSFDYFRESSLNPYESTERLGSLLPILDWKMSNV